MEKKQLKAAAALVLIAAAAFGVYKWRSGSGEVRQVARTSVVAKGSVAPVLAVTGAVAADQRSVNSGSSGKVAEIYVTDGQAVTAGQKLARLDGVSAQQQVNIAWANLKSARARLQELRDKSASAAEIATQDAAVAKAGAEYQNADQARDDLVITSPIAGTVIDIAANVGEQAGSGGGSNTAAAGTGSTAAGLVTVADLTKLYVTAAIDQADISKVGVGQEAKITLDALADKEFTGKVTFVDPVPTTSQNVVTYTAHISLDQQEPAIRLGMSADIAVDLGKKAGVLVVPNIAVRTRGKEKTVTKMVDGAETAVLVETGATDSENTEITSGLSVGDKIVLRSAQPSQASTDQSTRRSSFGGGFGGPVMMRRGN